METPNSYTAQSQEKPMDPETRALLVEALTALEPIVARFTAKLAQTKG